MRPRMSSEKLNFHKKTEKIHFSYTLEKRSYYITLGFDQLCSNGFISFLQYNFSIKMLKICKKNLQKMPK